MWIFKTFRHGKKNLKAPFQKCFKTKPHFFIFFLDFWLFFSYYTTYCIQECLRVHQKSRALYWMVYFGTNSLDVTSGPNSQKNSVQFLKLLLFCFSNWRVLKYCRLSPNQTKWALPQIRGHLYITPPVGSLFCEYIL